MLLRFFILSIFKKKKKLRSVKGTEDKKRKFNLSIIIATATSSDFKYFVRQLMYSFQMFKPTYPTQLEEKLQIELRSHRFKFNTR